MSDEPTGDGQVPLPEGDQSSPLPEEQVLDLLFRKPEEPPEDSETEPEGEQEQPTAVPDTADSHAEADEETPTVSTLLELAEAVEVDPGFLYGLEVPMGDGAKPMTIGELKDAATHISRSRTELEKEKVAVEAMKTRAAYDEALNKLNARLDLYREAFEEQADYRKQREKEDPGLVARAVQYYNDTVKKMEDEIEQKTLELEEKATEQLQQYHQHEAALLREKVPEWKDAEVAKKDLEAIWKLASEYGYSAEELQNLSDHRAIVILRDLAKVQDRIAAARGVPKKVAKLPKRLKSMTQTKSAETASQERLNERARESGRVTDQVAAVTSLLTGGS